MTAIQIAAMIVSCAITLVMAYFACRVAYLRGREDGMNRAYDIIAEKCEQLAKDMDGTDTVHK